MEIFTAVNNIEVLGICTLINADCLDYFKYIPDNKMKKYRLPRKLKKLRKRQIRNIFKWYINEPLEFERLTDKLNRIYGKK